MGKAIRESSVGTRLGKSSKLGMVIRDLRERTILVCVCGRHKTGWDEAKDRSYVESFDETS